MIHVVDGLIDHYHYAAGTAALGVLILALVGVILSRAMGKSAAWRDAWLFTILIGCLVVPIASFVFCLSGKPLITIAIPQGTKQAQTNQSDLAPNADQKKESTGDDLPNEVLHQRFDQIHAVDEVASDVNLSAEFNRPPVSLANNPVEQTRRSTASALILMACTIWFVGSLAVAFFTLRGFRRANQICLNSTQCSELPKSSVVASAAACVGLKKLPIIKRSTEVAAPVVWGSHCPTVILPESLARTIDAVELRNILIHEFAHIKRSDQLIVCFQAVARCLFWPIVTVHLLNQEINRSREEVCDNFVLSEDAPISYSEMLLRLAQSPMSSFPVADAVGILNRPGELELRIIRMLDPTVSRSKEIPKRLKLILSLAILASIFSICGTRLVTADSQSTLAGTSTAQPEKLQTARRTTDSIGDPLPESALLRLGTLRFRSPSHVTALALTPDEESLITIGKELICWDTKTGKERWRNDAVAAIGANGSSYGFRPIALSSDANAMFSIGGVRDGKCHIEQWDLRSGSQQTITVAMTKRRDDTVAGMRSIDVSQDGKYFVVGTIWGLIICDREGNPIFEIPNDPDHNDQFNAEEMNKDRLLFGGPYIMARFSPDGKKVACLTSDKPKLIRVFDVPSGISLRQIELQTRMVRFDFSPDSQKIVTTERDNAVRLYEVETGQRLWSHVVELNNIYENYTSGVAYSPDGNLIAAGATDNQIYLFDPSSGDEVGRLKGHHWYPWTLAFTKDSRMLYSAGWDGTIRRWDVKNRQPVALPEGVHGTEVIAASPDGITIAYQDDSRNIHLVNAASGVDIKTIPATSTKYTQLQFSPDGKRLAGGGSIKDEVQVSLWNTSDGSRYRDWKWPKGRDPHSHVEAFSFTTDGRQLAAAVFRQSKAFVWDVDSGDKLAELKHSGVYGLSFNPTGKNLATVGWDKRIQFWDTDNWTEDRTFKMPDEIEGDSRMYTVCYAPEGNLLATAHLSGIVSIWDPDEMILQKRFRVKNRFLYGAMSFSPDGLWLATGSSTGEIDLWDPWTGQKVWDNGKHQFIIYTVGFGRDSQTLVSGGDDGLGYLWDLHPVPRHEPGDADALWRELEDDDANIAYRAMWGLIDSPQQAVPLIAQKLAALTSLQPPVRITADRSTEETDQLRRMKKRLIEKDPRVESEITARRAIAVLAQCRTAEADKLLEELATKKSHEVLNQFARAALKRPSASEAAKK